MPTLLTPACITTQAIFIESVLPKIFVSEVSDIFVMPCCNEVFACGSPVLVGKLFKGQKKIAGSVNTKDDTAITISIAPNPANIDDGLVWVSNGTTLTKNNLFIEELTGALQECQWLKVSYECNGGIIESPAYQVGKYVNECNTDEICDPCSKGNKSNKCVIEISNVSIESLTPSGLGKIKFVGVNAKNGSSGTYEYSLNGYDWYNSFNGLPAFTGSQILQVRDKQVIGCIAKMALHHSIGVKEITLPCGGTPAVTPNAPNVPTPTATPNVPTPSATPNTPNVPTPTATPNTPNTPNVPNPTPNVTPNTPNVPTPTVPNVPTPVGVNCMQYEVSNNSGSIQNYSYPACGGGTNVGSILDGQSQIMCVAGGSNLVTNNNVPLENFSGVGFSTGISCNPNTPTPIVNNCNQFLYDNNSGATINYTYTSCAGTASVGSVANGMNVIICLQGGANNVKQGSTPIVAIAGVTVTGPTVCGSY